jgi:hypothetical protein
MTQARTKVRATVKIGFIHVLTVDLGFSLSLVSAIRPLPEATTNLLQR